MNEAGLDGVGESGPARTPASPILVLLGRPPPGQLTRVAGAPLVRARDPRSVGIYFSFSEAAGFA